jgi:serine/threonine protein kinase
MPSAVPNARPVATTPPPPPPPPAAPSLPFQSDSGGHRAPAPSVQPRQPSVPQNPLTQSGEIRAFVNTTERSEESLHVIPSAPWTVPQGTEEQAPPTPTQQWEQRVPQQWELPQSPPAPPPGPPQAAQWQIPPAPDSAAAPVPQWQEPPAQQWQQPPAQQSQQPPAQQWQQPPAQQSQQPPVQQWQPSSVQASEQAPPQPASYAEQWQQPVAQQQQTSYNEQQRPSLPTFNQVVPELGQSAPWQQAQAQQWDAVPVHQQRMADRPEEVPQPTPMPAPQATWTPEDVPTPERPVFVRDASFTGEDISEETLDMKFHVEKHEDPNIGKLVADRYRIVSMVGRGGMGVVYKAEHSNIDRIVAIKMLHPHIVADAETVKRFQQEAHAVSRVEHPHNVRIYDFGMTDLGQPFIVMDYIEGGSLREVLKRDGTLPMVRVGEIMEQVIDALACAHQAGVVHKDIKPENIMLTERSNKDFIYVVDFGISTLAQSGIHGVTEGRRETRGSPAYMSPEQCSKGAEVDLRSDIYSLAITTYEALVGKYPYAARNAIELLDAHVNGQAISLTAANPAFAACEALAAVLDQAMEKQPAKRQQTIEQFGSELADAIKRDAIRLNYLKNRKDLLNSGVNLPQTTPPDSIPRVQPVPDEAFDDTAGPADSSKHRAFQPQPTPGFLQMLMSLFGKNPHPVVGIDGGAEGRLVFANCPRCDEPVEAGIAFCLNCGRSLATTREFARIRAASGVFALPKSQESMSTAAPVFSAKARGSNTTALRLARQIGILVCVLAFIVAFCYFGGWQLITHGFSR